MIRSAVWTTLCSLLKSDLVAEAEPDSDWSAEDGFNDGRVELFQQLLWQVELPQLEFKLELRVDLLWDGKLWVFSYRKAELSLLNSK